MERTWLSLRISTLFILLGLPCFTGCTADNMRQGLYEGIRTRNDLQNSPAERAGKPEAPDYREYERQRKDQGYAK